MVVVVVLRLLLLLLLLLIRCRRRSRSSSRGRGRSWGRSRSRSRRKSTSTSTSSRSSRRRDGAGVVQQLILLETRPCVGVCTNFYYDSYCLYHCHRLYQIYHSCYHVTCAIADTPSRRLLPLLLLRQIRPLRVLVQAAKAAELDDQTLEACIVSVKVLQPGPAGALRLKDEGLL